MCVLSCGESCLGGIVGFCGIIFVRSKKYFDPHRTPSQCRVGVCGVGCRVCVRPAPRARRAHRHRAPTPPPQAQAPCRHPGVVAAKMRYVAWGHIYILNCSWSRCAPNLLKWPTAIGDQSRYNHAGFEDPVSTVSGQSVWTCPDTVWTEPPNLLKWGLTGRGSNVLKSRRPLTPTTSRCSRARTPATRARFLRCRAALGRSASRPRRHSGRTTHVTRAREW